MKPFVPVLAAAAAGAVLLFRPALPGAGTRAGGPAPLAAGGWTEAARHGGAAHPTAAPPAVVYVAGAVAHPGVYTLPADARARDAVARSGGMRPDADTVAVNLAAHVRDGDEIVVPVRGAALAPPARAGGRRAPHRAGTQYAYDARDPASLSRRSRHGRGPHRGAAPPAALIDLNTADADTLATIPGIGPGLALRIVAFRESNGAFASPDELLDVAGITDRRLDAILPYVVAR